MSWPSIVVEGEWNFALEREAPELSGQQGKWGTSLRMTAAFGKDCTVHRVVRVGRVTSCPGA